MGDGEGMSDDVAVSEGEPVVAPVESSVPVGGYPGLFAANRSFAVPGEEVARGVGKLIVPDPNLYPSVPDLGVDGYREWVAASEWVFAKTMPHIPHWYALRKKARDDLEFLAAVVFIRRYGVVRPWKNYRLTYLDLDDFRYWSMGAGIDETILVNREVITGASPAGDSAP